MDATRCDGIAPIGRRRMPPVSEPRRPGLGSKSWRERPRRRERWVAPRLSNRVVHATTCRSVSGRRGVTIGGEYAPPAKYDLRADHERILQVDPIHVHSGFLRQVARQICAACVLARRAGLRHTSATTDTR